MELDTTFRCYVCDCDVFLIVGRRNARYPGYDRAAQLNTTLFQSTQITHLRGDAATRTHKCQT